MVDFELEEDAIKQSKIDKFDRFYIVSERVKLTVEHITPSLKPGYELKYWSINRSVSLFYNGDFICTFVYELIEAGGLPHELEIRNVFGGS